MSKVICITPTAVAGSCPLSAYGYPFACCIAGADFWTVGSGGPDGVFDDATKFAARWHSSAWTRPTPPDNPGGGFWGVGAVDASHVYAVTQTQHDPASVSYDRVFGWDGSTWAEDTAGSWILPYATPDLARTYPYQAQGVAAVSSSDVWVFGFDQVSLGTFSGDPSIGPQAQARHYDGSSWAYVDIPINQATPLSGIRHAVKCNSVGQAGASHVWIAGYDDLFDTSTSVASRAQHAQRVGGTALSAADQLTGTYGQLLAVQPLSDGTAVACGWAFPSGYSGGTSTPYDTADPSVMRWSGSAWAALGTLPALPSGYTGGRLLTGISGVAPDDLWAVGFLVETGFASQIPLIYHWDGSAWTDTSPTQFNVPGQYAYLNGVAAAATDDVWAVGAVDCLPDYLEHTLVLHWNGSAWAEREIPA